MFASAMAASYAFSGTGVSEDDIVKCCRGHTEEAGGYCWQYASLLSPPVAHLSKSPEPVADTTANASASASKRSRVSVFGEDSTGTDRPFAKYASIFDFGDEVQVFPEMELDEAAAKEHEHEHEQEQEGDEVLPTLSIVPKFHLRPARCRVEKTSDPCWHWLRTAHEPSPNSGKWMRFSNKDSLTETFAKIASLMSEGLLGFCCKMTNFENSTSSGGVMCVYVSDHENVVDVFRVLLGLRDGLGLTDRMYFKTDHATIEGNGRMSWCKYRSPKNVDGVVSLSLNHPTRSDKNSEGDTLAVRVPLRFHKRDSDGALQSDLVPWASLLTICCSADKHGVSHFLAVTGQHPWDDKPLSSWVVT